MGISSGFHEEELKKEEKVSSKENPLKFIHFNNGEPKSLSKKARINYQSRTVAALTLSPNAIRQLATDFVNIEQDTQLFTEMTVGITLLSKEDKYCKKTGRDEAVRKMAEISLQVLSVVVNPTHIYVSLAQHQGVVLTLRLNKNTGFSTVVGQM